MSRAGRDPRRSLRPTVDELSEWSFPASDPPATWTWEVERPQPTPPAASLRSQTVVVGFDGSPASERALRRAAAIAGRVGRVIVVTASPSVLPRSAASDEPVLDGPRPEERSAILRRSEVLLREHGIEPTLVAMDCDPVEALIQVAREQRAELILVGRTGSHYMTRALLGSTAENVIRHAPCDVVIVR